MRRMLSGNSVWLVILGPVPRQLGPHSRHVCQRYPLFSLKYLLIAGPLAPCYYSATTSLVDLARALMASMLGLEALVTLTTPLYLASAVSIASRYAGFAYKS